MLARTLAMAACAWGAATTAAASTLLFSPEGNRLNVYDADTGAKRTLIRSFADAPDDPASRDINGQICFGEADGRRVFISGEDTVGAGGGGSHGERIAGWGVFELAGNALETLSATQIGKLNPTYAGDPDNFGCGFLEDGRLVTSALGNTLPGEEANGELILWFPPLDVFQDVDGDGNLLPSTNFCKLDVTLATTGGIWIDGSDIYVATNRFDNSGNPGGVWKFSPAGDGYPTSPDAAGGCGRADPEGGPLVDEGRVTRELFLPPVPLWPADPTSPTASAIVSSGGSRLDGASSFYVSSVFTGTVGEYDANGIFRRYVLAPPFGGQLIGVTPFGMATGPDGTLYVADLGIVGPGPSGGAGSVVRIRFDDLGLALPPEVIDGALNFPDGLGIVTLD